MYSKLANYAQNLKGITTVAKLVNYVQNLKDTIEANKNSNRLYSLFM